MFKLILDDESKQYEAKVSALLTTWEKIASLIQNCEDAVDNLFTENLHRDTLQLVLQGEWPKLSPIILTHLTVTLQRCINSVNGSLREKVARLKHIVQEPWGHPTLQKILASDVANIKPVEAQEFCSSEGVLVLLVRLKVLCASKCEDIALKLSRLCFPYWRLNPRCSAEHWTQLRDTHIALLYRFKLISNIVDEVLQRMSFEEGAKMVQHHSSLPTSRLWKHPNKVAMLESCYFLSAALKQPCVSCSLEEVLHVWLELHRSSQTSQAALCEYLRALTTEVNSEQIHALCACLTKELGPDLQAFYIELYIRGLNFDLNSLGHHKLESDKEKVREIECRLSKSFLHLAELLSDSVAVSKECVLTAFSLYPSEETFARVQAFAPSNVDMNSAIGEINAGKSIYNELSIPDQLLDAASLGLSQQLCDDLLVVINNPRWHSLNWLLKWSDLESLCKRYLQDPEGSRYVIKELNFLDIDYEKFKDLPSKQYCGIEEGYEHCVYPTPKRGRKRKPGGCKAKAKPKPAKLLKEVTKKPKEISLTVISEAESLKDLLKSESLEIKSDLELNLKTQTILVPQPKRLPDSHLEINKAMVTLTVPISQPIATTQPKISHPHLEIENPRPTQTISVSRPVVRCKRLKVSDSHNKIVLVEPQVSNSEIKIIKHVKKGSRSNCPSILKRSQSNKSVDNLTLQETDSVRSLRWLPVRASIAAAVNNWTSYDTEMPTDSAKSLSCLPSIASVNDSTSQETGVPTDSASIAAVNNLTSHSTEMPTNNAKSIAPANDSTAQETEVPTGSDRMLRYLPVRASIAASIVQKTGIPIHCAKSLRYASVDNSTSQVAGIPTDSALPSVAPIVNSISQETGMPNDSTKSLRWLPVRASIAASLLQNTQQQTMVFKKLEPRPIKHVSKKDKLLHLDSISPAITALSSVFQTQETQQPNSSTIFKLNSISLSQHQMPEIQNTYKPTTECKQESIPRTITVVPTLTQQQESFPIDLKQAIMYQIMSILPQTECLNMAGSSSSKETASVDTNHVTHVPNVIPTIQPATGVTIRLCDASERNYQGKNSPAISHCKIIESSGIEKIVPLMGRTIMSPHLQHNGSARTKIFAPSFTQIHKPTMAGKRKALPELLPMPKPPKLSAMTLPPKLPVMALKPARGYVVRQQTTVKSCSAKPPKLSAALRLDPPKLKPMVDLKPRIALKTAVHPKLAKTKNTEKLTFGFCSDIRLSTSPIKSVPSKPAATQTRPKQPQNKLPPTTSKPNFLLKPSAIQYKHSSTETENNLNVTKGNNSKLLPSILPVSRVYGFLSNAVKKQNILNEAQNLLNQSFVGKTLLSVQETKVQQQQQTSQSKTFQCHYLRPNFPFKQSLNFKRQNDSESALINQTACDEQRSEKESNSTESNDFCEAQSDYKIEVLERKRNLIRCTISEEIDCNNVQNMNIANKLSEFEIRNHDSVETTVSEETDFGHTPNMLINCPLQLEQSFNQSPVKGEKLENPNCTADGEQLNDFEYVVDKVKHETSENQLETEVTEVINPQEINDLLAELFPDPEPTEW